jgi:hypothetical protein
MTRETLLQALEAERLHPRREKMISIRFTAEELARLQAAARAHRVAAASLARLLILDGLAMLEPVKAGEKRRKAAGGRHGS